MIFSQRQLKVSELIKQALIEVLRNGKMLEPSLIDAKITVSNVEVSPDLKIAKCFVLNFPQSKLSEDELITSLEKSKFAIRSMITKKIQLKYSPEIRFIYDHSFNYADKINKLLSHE